MAISKSTGHWASSDWASSWCPVMDTMDRAHGPCTLVVYMGSAHGWCTWTVHMDSAYKLCTWTVFMDCAHGQYTAPYLGEPKPESIFMT